MSDLSVPVAEATPLATVIRFRCMNVAVAHTGESTVQLLPVIPKSPGWPGGAEENASFFQATPAGEIRLICKKGDTTFQPGAYYQFHIQQLPPCDPSSSTSLTLREWAWMLREVAYRDGEQAVKLERCWNTGAGPILQGFMTLQITNPKAWPTFPHIFPAFYHIGHALIHVPEDAGSTYP